MDVCKPCKVYEWYLRKLELHLLFTGNNERVQHIRMIWSLSKIVYIITTSVNYLSVSNSPFSKWKWKSLSCIRLFVTPWTIQFMEFSRSEYWSRYPFPSPWDRTQVSRLQAGSLPAEPPGKPKNTGLGSLSLLQWIFPTQKSSQGLLHCWQILYQMSCQWDPIFKGRV